MRPQSDLFIAKVIGFALILCLALPVVSLCQTTTNESHREALIVLPSSSDVKYAKVQGTFQLTYKVRVGYPAKTALNRISEKLRQQGWKPLKQDFFNPAIPSSLVRGWTQFADQTTTPETRVTQWMAEWQDLHQDIVSYTLRYRYPTTDNEYPRDLAVAAIFIPAPIAIKMRNVGPK
ncbi:MAG TPA: hypothetical protein VGR72_01520 [Candidatus Acidoferrales bacterium]|nr:hypothetical protein [Candidatus Acidoferrales bacterium]